MGHMGRQPKRGDLELQVQALAKLAEAPPEQLTAEQLETIFDAAARPASDEVQVRAAVLLSQLYPTRAPNDPDFARRTHTILLRDLRQPRKTLAHPSCSWLVMTHLREENLAHIPWESTEEVASAAECFYGFCVDGLSSEESHRRVRDLVKYAGHHFAQQGRWEEVFQLLNRVQLPTAMMDADLFRLRSTLVLYEQRRVRRVQHSLLLVMAGVVAFILFLSPLIFLASENDAREAHGAAPLSFFEGLYWSVVTFTTLGYGEIVPYTIPGRILSMLDSLLGMTLMGVIAGLILSAVTPRRLP
jgi:hypothetical protein